MFKNYLNFSKVKDDSSAQNAFRWVPRNCILVMEDIDASCKAVLSRDHYDTQKKANSKGNSITLSTLLSLLDGILLNHGVILIMTTNHPEKLDPALIRPGRIDLHLRLGNATNYQLNHMYRNVLQHSDQQFGEELDLEGMEEGVIPPCEAMGIFLLYKDSGGSVISSLLKERYQELLEERKRDAVLSFEFKMSSSVDEAPEIAKQLDDTQVHRKPGEITDLLDMSDSSLLTFWNESA